MGSTPYSSSTTSLLEPLNTTKTTTTTTMKPHENEEIESGYASASSESSRSSTPSSSPSPSHSISSSPTSSPSSSTTSLPQIRLTKAHLSYLNAQMAKMSAPERLRFAVQVFPNLYQSTAFGLTGLVTMDMLWRLSEAEPELPRVEAVFLDTLHHFPETYDLVARARERYPSVRVHVYRPAGAETERDFAARYGAALYATDAERYDWAAKVEPQQRAYADLGVAAVLTGRRRSQGGERGAVSVLEVVDEEGGGMLKINPLFDWSFSDVRAYITAHAVPYNALLDRGYKSVGDWHSTSPVAAGEDERAGRWKGQEKTECGIHNKKSRYAQFLMEQQLKQQQQQQQGQQGQQEQS